MLINRMTSPRTELLSATEVNTNKREAMSYRDDSENPRFPSDPASGPALRTASLAEASKRWRQSMKDAARGPLLVAKEVVTFVANWDQYKVEAKGLDASSWLRSVFGAGHNLRWFEARANAVNVLGTEMSKALHHDAALWVASTVPAPYLDKTKRALLEAWIANMRAPLTTPQALLVARKIIGKKFQRTYGGKWFDRCVMLEALLRKHGIAVPD